jgi:Xaa-Pro aminopeptidase
VTSLDEIAWFLNLRGNDIDFNPVFFSYLIFHPSTKKVDLFIDAVKLSDLPQGYLTENNITVKPYEAIDFEL